MLRTLVTLVLLGGLAHAQSKEVDLDYRAMTQAKAGAWAEYKVSVKNPKGTSKMRYSLVGKGENWMVLEIETAAEKAPVLMRLEYALTGPEEWRITSGKMAVKDERRDLSAAELSLSPPLNPRAQPGELVGTETVKTPAGTFECQHYQKQIPIDGGKLAVHLWMSPNAGPTGLVKSVAPLRGIEVTLVKTGVGAKPKVK
jgi:hypothetical protein